jgi:hypothetical protein
MVDSVLENFCRKCGVELRHNGFYCNNCEYDINKDLVEAKKAEEQRRYREEVLKRDMELRKNDYP